MSDLLSSAVDVAMRRVNRTRGLIATVWAWPSGGAYMVTSTSSDFDEALDGGWVFCAEHINQTNGSKV